MADRGINWTNREQMGANACRALGPEPGREQDIIYREDALRLGSFRTWPNINVSRESLAVAGFYFIAGVKGEPGDKVRCAWCSGEIENWSLGDCPITEHIRHFPNCSHAKDMSKRITQSQLYNEDLLYNNPAELGIIGVNHGILTIMHATFESRLETFANWPENNTHTPESLASAGFYYTGRDDEVRCFQCRVGLSKWEPTDDPWIEHAKYSSSCSFLILRQGRDFAEDPRSHTPRIIDNSQRSINRRGRIHSVTDADVENCMGSSYAIIALHCGLQPDRIRKAIRIRLNQTGIPFTSPDDLIDAALNEQLNETPFSIPESRPVSQTASSSTTRFNVNDAAIDVVTRMIINSALVAEEVEQRNSISPNLQEAPSDLDRAIEDNIENISNITIVDQNIADNRVVQSVNNTESQELSKVTVNEPISLEEENKLLKDARTCKICMDSEVSVVFLPCGHLVSCELCAKNLPQCPICRANIKGIVRTYLS